MLGDESNIQISNILAVAPVQKFLDPSSVFWFLLEPSYVLYKRGVTPRHCNTREIEESIKKNCQVIITY